MPPSSLPTQFLFYIFRKKGREGVEKETKHQSASHGIPMLLSMCFHEESGIELRAKESYVHCPLGQLMNSWVLFFLQHISHYFDCLILLWSWDFSQLYLPKALEWPGIFLNNHFDSQNWLILIRCNTDFLDRWHGCCENASTSICWTS